jgi:hypothetical protein
MFLGTISKVSSKSLLPNLSFLGPKNIFGRIFGEIFGKMEEVVYEEEKLQGAVRKAQSEQVQGGLSVVQRYSEPICRQASI